MIKNKKSLDRFGLLDLGTNSVRFDVYEFQGRNLYRVYREKSMVRLGDGVFETGKLSAASRRRTLAAIKRFQRIRIEYGIERIIAVGTSAMRTAKNGKAFAKEIYNATGIRVKIITGKVESRLIAKGIMSQLRMPADLTALVDIGGGSTEISFIKNNKILKQVSLRLGANRLHQTFLHGSPPVKKMDGLYPDLALRQKLRKEFKSIENWLGDRQCIQIIGSSGTIRNLGKVLKRAKCKSQPFRRRDLAALVAEMRLKNKRQLAALPGIEKKRVDLILAGAILFEELMYTIKCEKFYVTDLALRDGLLVEELESNYE